MLLCVLCFAFAGQAEEQQTGEALFKAKCAACHPKAEKITGKRSIIRIMRNPPPYMPVFDDERIPEKDAREIEDYIFRLLKKEV